MTTHQRPLSGAKASAAFRALMGFTEEACALIGALLSPNKTIEEVEQVRALLVEANRIEASDPLRAEVLCQRASRIGVR